MFFILNEFRSAVSSDSLTSGKRSSILIVSIIILKEENVVKGDMILLFLSFQNYYGRL